jgi:RNA polymerase sigma factor (sigma-70 family)
MVSVLTRIFGTSHLETAEDVVQQTFITAINTWKLKGLPDNPSAWLFRVARNKATDIIRRNRHTVHYDFSENERALLSSGYTLSPVIEKLFSEELVKDDMLRMMFACCHPGLSAENQITIILKTLCGLSTAEIARAFLCPEDTVSKRLYRTKAFFRENNIRLEIPSVKDLRERTSAVLHAIYLLFNEGYNSTHSEKLIRPELIDEAMMLGKVLIENPHTQLPEAYALMALMCFHSARSKSRLGPNGAMILLAEQDRSQWDHRLIDEGNLYMNLGASGEEISPYHIEAAIAFEHCAAPDFESTNWQRILELYDWLMRIAPSPVTELNRIAAVMQADGPQKALYELSNMPEAGMLKGYYLYHVVLGEIYSRTGNPKEAKLAFDRAAALTGSEIERNVILGKIAALAA